MNPESNKKPDIIIVDDHLIFRQGIKAIINFEEIGSIIAEASNGEDFLALLSGLKPDLVLMDIDMPGMNGFDATKKALELIPDLKIIAFTVFSEEEYCTKMMKLGAKGFILKSSGFNELENAIKQVMKGENYFAGDYHQNNYQGIDTKVQAADREIEDAPIQNIKKMLFFPWFVPKTNSINT